MEPKERLHKARRILAVRASLERLATWRAIDLECQEKALHTRRDHLVRYLDGETMLGEAFSRGVSRRLQSLAEHEAVLKVEKETQATRCLEERQGLRCTERIVDALERETRSAEELRELEQVIEASLRRRRVRPEQG